MPPKSSSPRPSMTTRSRAELESDLLEPGESVLRTVHRHFIGIVSYFLVAIVAVVAILALIFVLSPDSLRLGSADVMLMMLIVVGLAFVSLMLFILIYIYRQSKLLITDRSLVQINQVTLFNRKVSRLSMSNVEDVSAEQRGFFATIFNYGTLVVQTAGEMENFVFKLCPNPNHFADIVIEARQAYAQRLEEDKEP